MIEYPNRTLCYILDDMRRLHETRNYSGLAGLIEELQYYGNRMEASLEDKRDCYQWAKLRSKLKAEIRQLKATKKELGGEDERVVSRPFDMGDE